MKKAQVLLTTIFGISAICLMLLIGAILIWRIVAIDQAQTRSTQLQEAQILSAKIRAFFEGAEEQLRSTTQVMNIAKPDRDEQESILSTLLSEDGLYEELVLLDSTGEEQIYLSLQRTSPSTNPGNWSETDEFVIPKTRNEVYYGPISFDETTGEPCVMLKGVAFWSTIWEAW